MQLLKLEQEDFASQTKQSNKLMSRYVRSEMECLRP